MADLDMFIQCKLKDKQAQLEICNKDAAVTNELDAEIKELQSEIEKQKDNRKKNSMQLFELFDLFRSEINNLKQEIVDLKKENETLIERVLFLEDHSKDVLRRQLERGKFLLDPASIKGDGLTLSAYSMRGIKAQLSPSCVLGSRCFPMEGGEGGDRPHSKVSWGVRFLGPRKPFISYYYVLLGVHSSPSTMRDNPWISEDRGEEGVFALSFSIADSPDRCHGGVREYGVAGRDPEGNERRVSVGDEVMVTLDYGAGTLSFYHPTPPTYCSYIHGLPLDTPLYPYFYSLDLDFEIYFSA
jgi:hypothetical protein